MRDRDNAEEHRKTKNEKEKYVTRKEAYGVLSGSTAGVCACVCIYTEHRKIVQYRIEQREKREKSTIQSRMYGNQEQMS